jgi:hypothetical protein
MIVRLRSKLGGATALRASTMRPKSLHIIDRSKTGAIDFEYSRRCAHYDVGRADNISSANASKN